MQPTTSIGWRFRWLLSGAALLAIGLAAGAGSIIGTRLAQPSIGPTLPIELNAGTAARTSTMSIATGFVDENVEGLWVLDHLTGNLQCWVLNPRTAQVGGIYQTNVAADLMAGKTGDAEYMMVTGSFIFDGGNLGNNVPGNSVCYIADAKTGNVVGYGVVYNKQAIKRGVVQAGPLQLVCSGKARPTTTERDQ